MVTLRVDVQAAQARREFTATSRSVDNFADQLQQAQRAANALDGDLTAANARMAQSQREFDAASRAADDAADEVRRLRAQMDALGGAAPAALTRQLREAENELRRLEREEQRSLDRLSETTHQANQLGRAFNDAGDRVQHITRQLAEARREADRLRLAMDAANRRASNPLRGAQRGLLGFRQQINQALSQSPGSGLRDAMSRAWSSLPVELKGVVVAAGASLAAIFATAAGAAVNGLILAAVGGGVLAGLTALAVKSSTVVQKAFADTFKPIGQEISRFSLMAEGPLVHVAQIFGQAWKDVSADVRGAFADILDSGALENLAQGISGFVREVMPGFREALKAAGPILKELGDDLPILGRAVSDMFHSFSEGSDGAVKGIRALVVVLAASIEVIGDTIEFLSKRFDQITNDMELFFVGASKIPVIGKMFEGAAEFMKNFNTAGDGSARSLNAVGEAADQSALGMGRQADATSRAAAATYSLTAKMSGLLDEEMNATRASIGYEAALDALTESVKQNGRNLDITTEKGRNNANAILDVADAAQRKLEADIALAGGEKASGAAIDAATGKFRAQIDQLEATLRKMGFTQAQIDALLGSYRKIADAPNITKSITVTTEYRTIGSIPKDQRVGAGVIRGYATGGNPPPGWAWVGEHGKELVNFTGAEKVYSAAESAKLMGEQRAAAAKASVSTGGGATMHPVTYAPVFNVYPTAPVGSTPADVGKAVVEAIKSYEKTSGTGWRRT